MDAGSDSRNSSFPRSFNLFFTRWSEESWLMWWRYRPRISARGCCSGVVTTVWFTWGGVRDLRRLFRHLKARQDAPGEEQDDGRVHARGE
ncbi:MAG: hypothetical protein V8T86_02255 [Victivallis sp.]